MIVAIIIIIVFIAASIFSGGMLMPAIVGTLGTIATVADLGLLAHDFLATGFGIIDENADGCLFPMYGFNHTYAFGFPLDEVTEDAANNINPTIPPETILAVEDWLVKSNFWSKITVLGLLGGISLAGLKGLL